MSRALPLLLLPLVACDLVDAVEEHVIDGPVHRVVLATGSADVRVVASDAAEGARVTERSAWRGEPPEVRVTAVDGELRVEADCDHGLSIGPTCTVDLTVEVPATAALAGTLASGDLGVEGLRGGVELSTGSGNVDLDDLAGEVWLEARSGNVTARRLAATVLTVDVGSGDVAIEDELAPVDAWLATRSGNVHFVVPAGAYAVSTDTGSGDVDVTGVDRDPDAVGRITIQTGSGDITLVGR